MKIALVNLCKIEDISKAPFYESSFKFLMENNIEHIDYASGRASFKDLLNGFHDALSNPEVDLIWFVQGGSSLVKFLPDINWTLVKESRKSFFGLSDFTHFSLHASCYGVPCFYGQGLKHVKDYLPTESSRQFLVDFLKSGFIEPLSPKLLYGDNVIKWDSAKIVGGHSFISAIMLPHLQCNLDNKVLFLEHHYIKQEGLDNASYFIEAVKLYLHKHKPQAILLGHSMVYGNDGELMDMDAVNKSFVELLNTLHVPIFSVDHFKTVIKFS